VTYLINSEDSQRFLGMASTETGSSALLGDAEAFPVAGPYMTKAQIELRNAVGKIAALANDPTRTDVQRHAAARELANRTIETLQSSANSIAQQSKMLVANAQERANSNFAPRPGHDALNSEIRRWIAEQAKTPEGLINIRKQMERSEDVAAVIWHSPDFLLNINSDVCETLKYEALQRHYPEIYADLATGHLLNDMPKKYQSVIRNVGRFFFNPSLAEQVSRRVEI